MPTWGKILKEINASKGPLGGPNFDGVRRKYLQMLSSHTQRDVIIYATKWTDNDPNTPTEMSAITPEDVQGFMEVVSGLKKKALDLVLHSPGGQTNVVEPVVDYLRSKFDHIRVFVPQSAMSAATMIACAAEEIWMGKHSSLGPIDPQFVLQTHLGNRMVPAQAILAQFDKAKDECQNPSLLSAWIPILQQFGPDLLIQCENWSQLSLELVAQFLEAYMFKGDANAHQKSGDIAKFLASHEINKVHGRFLSRALLQSKGLVIKDLEDDEALQDIVLSVFHSSTITMAQTGTMKIIENQNGNAFIKQVQMVPIIQPPKSSKTK